MQANIQNTASIAEIFTARIISLMASDRAERLAKKRISYKVYYERNKERILARVNSWRRLHPEIHRAQNRRYYRTETGKLLAKQSRKRCARQRVIQNRRWRQANPQKAKTYSAKWRSNNLEKARENWRRYYVANREKLAAKSQRRCKLKYATRPSFKMQMAGYRALNKTIARKHTSKRTEALLGCNFEQLKNHVESQFKPGMNWENYGVFGWHLDHKRPIASFDLTDAAQVERCFHYSNLQPLWAEENIRKSNKLTPA